MIIFTDENGVEKEFEIIADTVIGGISYLLVAQGADGTGSDEEEACILKDVSDESDEEASYVILTDEAEIDAVARVFEADNDISIV